MASESETVVADVSSMSENQACSWCRENCHRIHDTNGRSSATSTAPLSFCKIITESMLTGKPSAHMQLPTSFVRRCNEALGPVTLKGPFGQEWKVEFSGSREDDMGFRSGWRDFSSYHNLTKGDVLFFWKTAESCFCVLIFDKNGCEKDPASVVSDMQGCKFDPLPKKRNGLEVESCEDAKRSMKSSKSEIQVRHDNAYLKRLRSEDHDKEKSTQCSNAAMDSTTKEEAVHKVFDDSTMSSTKTRLFHASTSESFGRGMCEPLSMHVVDILPPGTQSLLSAESLSKYPRYHNQRATVFQRRPVTEQERQKTLQDAQAYKSHKPLAIVAMKGSYVCRGCKLYLPAAFVKKWFPADAAQVILVNSDGEKFQVKWLGSKHSSTPCLSGGWRGFVQAHGIEEGDVCVFELRSRNPVLLRVFLYRVLECGSRAEAHVSCERSTLASAKHIAEKSGAHLKMEDESLKESRQAVETAEDSVDFQSKRGQILDRANPQSVLKDTIGDQAELGIVPQIDNIIKQVDYESSLKVSASCSGAKKKVKHTANESERTSISPEESISDDSTHLKLAPYKVERLIGRRISENSKTSEFLVQLESTQDLVKITTFEKEGNGAWWVPFSHFTEDLMTCYA